MDKTQLETAAFFVLFAAASVLVFLVFWPFAQILALAAALAILCRKPFKWLTRFLGGRESAAAGLCVVALLLFCILPLFFLGLQIFNEAQSFYLASQSGGTSSLQALEAALEAPVRHFYPAFTLSLHTYSAGALSFVSQNLGNLLSQTLYLFLETSLLLLAFFFFLRDRDKMFAALIALSPFRREHTDEIFANLERTINSVLRGTLLVALVRWACFAVAFYVLGIPGALLWSSAGGIVGAVPGLGTLFVVVPALVYLYLAGHLLAALLFGLFGLGIMVSVDNLLTGYFFGRGLEVSPIFISCSLLGGIFFFGPAGFILGPLCLSLFLSTLDMYRLLLLKK